MESSGRTNERAGDALSHLTEVLRLSLAAYRDAGKTVEWPLIGAAVNGLIEDHERHLAEIEAALGRSGGGVRSRPGTPDLAAAFHATAATSESQPTVWLDALIQAESRVADAFRDRLEHGVPERHRGMIRRQLAEENAHISWLRESDILRRLRVEKDHHILSAG